MLIRVDARETALLDELRDNPIRSLSSYLSSATTKTCSIVLDSDPYPSTTNVDVDDEPERVVCRNPNHALRRERLVLGDAIISISTNDDEPESGTDTKDIVLFERKTLADFAASIRDGRYKEQSYRLNKHCELSNHNIVYIIEGDLSKYADRSKCGNVITKKALYSAMFSMMFYKGFSVVRTMNIRETADLILNFADKYDSTAETLRGFYYKRKTGCDSSDSISSAVLPPQPDDDYAAVFKNKNKHKERASQITPENIGEIMLSSIPCVSAKTAAVIMREFKTIASLIERLKQDRHCLDNLYITTEQTGSKRKINKSCIENLFKFLIAA
jgi:ERCC4-type nuclease